jgi:hypothetical protein
MSEQLTQQLIPETSTRIVVGGLAPVTAGRSTPPGRRFLGVRERVGHRWWALVLFLNSVVAPATALFLAGWFKDHLLLIYLLTIILFPVINFFRAILTREYAVTRALFSYKREAYVLMSEGAESLLNEDEWRVQDWRERAGALLRGLLRLEFFGWIVWVSSTTLGIADALKKVTPELLDKTPGTTPLDSWYWVLNEAAYNLIRATVIGTIGLFFAQLIRKFQITIDKADQAASGANTAAVEASRAVKEAITTIPQLEGQVRKTLNILNTSYNILESETLSHHLSTTLELIAESDPALEQVKELSERIVARIGQINEEITHTFIGTRGTPQRDLFDLVSLSALYTTYLKVETLSFEGPETGRRGCRLSTRYPHYALAVRSVVEALYRLDSERYRFYTIFNRAPEHFFNPENPDVESPLANVNWTVLFLEDFCRKHNRDQVPYTRYFITLDDEEGRPKGKIPPTDAVVRYDLSSSFILCSMRDSKYRPFLWGESAWMVFSDEQHLGSDSDGVSPGWSYLSRSELKAMQEAAREIIPPKEFQDTLKSLGGLLKLADPSYVIVDEESRVKVENVILPLQPDIKLLPLRDIMLDYHNPECHPIILKFKNWQKYKEFFFNDGIPRDLIGVWDKRAGQDGKGDWCLCMGTMVGESDPTAVVMTYITERRELKDLPWDRLKKKLSLLFCEDLSGDRDCAGMSREPL